MKSHGALCEARLGWLAARLAEQPDRPTLVLRHHPPFQTGIEHMDAIGLLAGGPELERIVARYPRVERVLCGHLHRTIFRRFGGTIASTCPGTAHQLALELGPRPTLQYTVSYTHLDVYKRQVFGGGKPGYVAHGKTWPCRRPGATGVPAGLASGRLFQLSSPFGSC